MKNSKSKLVKYAKLKYYTMPHSGRRSYSVYKGKNNRKDIKVVAIMRMRNEELLLKDSLDHLSSIVDGILIFDDVSEDGSTKIALNHPLTLELIKRKRWQKKNRPWSETTDRNILLKRSKKYTPDWVFCVDADERFEGSIKDYLLNECPSSIDGIRVTLIDAYLTKEDKSSFLKGQQLYNFRKYFGPEKRDILMIWRPRKRVFFKMPVARTPEGIPENKIITKFWCQHYGKAVSVKQWDLKCIYYAENFPEYSKKWESRIGKAIHTVSDFDNPLYTWSTVKEHLIPMRVAESKSTHKTKK